MSDETKETLEAKPAIKTGTLKLSAECLAVIKKLTGIEDEAKASEHFAKTCFECRVFLPGAVRALTPATPPQKRG